MPNRKLTRNYYSVNELETHRRCTTAGHGKPRDIGGCRRPISARKTRARRAAAAHKHAAPFAGRRAGAALRAPPRHVPRASAPVPPCLPTMPESRPTRRRWVASDPKHQIPMHAAGSSSVPQRSPASPPAQCPVPPRRRAVAGARRAAADLEASGVCGFALRIHRISD